jgi:putative ABC transport system permease protein
MSVLLLIKPLDGHSDEIATIVLDLLESRHPGYSRGSIVDIRDSIDAVIRSREGVYVVLSVFTLLSFMSALLYLSATFLIEGIQKTKEIGIKRAIGAEQQMIQKEFVWKGLRIGLTALGIGVCAGSLATFVLAKSEGMTFSLQPGLLLGFVMSCCACLLLASFIPAAYASRIAPVDALRKELMSNVHKEKR